MKRTIKIYLKEHLDPRTKQTWIFYKGIALNDVEKQAIFADIKWFVKKEIVKEIVGNGGIFDVEIKGIKERKYITKNGDSKTGYIFEISEIEPTKNLHFLDKLEDILQKGNREFIEKVFSME